MSFNLTAPLPEKGVAVPIYATFTGHEKMPFWWAISTNNANPKLRLFEDELELKVMKLTVVRSKILFVLMLIVAKSKLTT